MKILYSRDHNVIMSRGHAFILTKLLSLITRTVTYYIKHTLLISGSIKSNSASIKSNSAFCVDNVTPAEKHCPPMAI